MLKDANDYHSLCLLFSCATQLDIPAKKKALFHAHHSWCSLVLGKTSAAWNSARKAIDLFEDEEVGQACHRAFMVSGYVCDMRGQHHIAESWYRRALPVSLPNKVANTWLEIGTSLSKQGQLGQSLLAFQHAEEAIDPENTKHNRILAHILSRRAIVYEIQQDLKKALREQDRALSLAIDSNSGELEFSIWCRKARIFLTTQNFEEAKGSLEKAASLKHQAKKGEIDLTHDWARFFRGKREWRKSIAFYRKTLELIPHDEELLFSHNDLWLEVLDGLLECLRHSEGAPSNLSHVINARQELQAMRESAGIYNAQSLTRSELMSRALDPIRRIRQFLRNSDSEGFVSNGCRFDLKSGLIIQLGATLSPTKLRNETTRLFLSFLLSQPGNEASHSEIITHLRDVCDVTGGDKTYVRKIVSNLKADLRNLGIEIGPRDFIVARRKPPGYKLLID